MFELTITKENREKLLSMFSEYRRIDLSVDSVIEGTSGKIYINNIQNPEVYFLVNGPFYFIVGNSEANNSTEMLKQIPKNCHIMGVSKDWINKLQELHKDNFLFYLRFIFSSESLAIKKIQNIIDASYYKDKIKRISLNSAREISLDRIHSYHLDNFSSPEDFFNRGIGYYYKEDNKLIGIASSALVCSRGIEVNIMVIPEYQRRGIAKALAGHLIKYCLENKIDPHWNAGSEISFKLAESLGYKFEEKYLTYYFNWN